MVVIFLKLTNRTVSALQTLAKPIKTFEQYKELIENLYFLFHEGPGSKLSENNPESFSDINKFRTSLQHDLNHGKSSKVRKKQIDIGDAFKKYSGHESPEMLTDDSYAVVQANLLNALIRDLLDLENRLKA